MKTSNKLLFGLFLFLLFIFASIHFTLYTKYKKGDIITGNKLMSEQFSEYHFPVPRFLSIQDFEWVRIIPCDSFYIKIANNGMKVTKQLFSYQGDTLAIKGDPAITRNQFGNLSSNTGYWQVIVFCPPVKGIQLLNADAALTGEPASALSEYHFKLNNANLVIGSVDYPDTLVHRQYFHNIFIDAIAGNTILNKNAHTDSLTIRLDNKSITTDNGTSLGSLEITCDEQSKLSLTPGNLKKLRLIAEH